MGYQCSVPLKGLVNGEPPTKTNKKTGKQYKNRHRANGLAIAKEMLPERASRSKTLDRDRSYLNTYEGFSSGEDCWAAMVADVDDYRMPVKLRNGSTAYRKLSEKMKADLVLGWSFILNPPPEMTVGWTEDDYDRFDDDALDVLGEICPIFKPKNVRAKAKHRDEGRKFPGRINGGFGRHTHFIGDCLDEQGRYCGQVINGALYDRINREFPAKMRERGWDLDDLDVTDWEKARTDPEYKAEREEKRRNQSRDVNQVIADDRHEARVELAEAREQASRVERSAATRIREAEHREKMAQAKIDEAMEKEKQLTALSGAIFNAQLEKSRLEADLGDLTEFRSWKAQKAAQEAQERRAKEKADQDARDAEKRRQGPSAAAEQARREQVARQVAQTARKSSELLTEDDMLAEFRRRMGRAADDTPPEIREVEPAEQETPLEPPRDTTSLADLLMRVSNAANRKASGRDGPSYPGA